MSYPSDFPTPTDMGGPGAGQPIGGFGGDPAGDQDSHRAALAASGRAPVLLVHGNAGAADNPPWDMLDLRQMLLDAGYPAEVIWAPSYLANGVVDLLTPHTNNIDDVRTYLETVCQYLDVAVVDIVGHSLGCTLMYSVFRGLDRQTSPVSWNQPKKWHRVGTFVALAGAFHGLGTGSVGEWQTGAEFMDELLTETLGGGGETPFRAGGPQTPGPVPHHITYFCGTAAGDFVDSQNPGTGSLSGATNRSYNLGSGRDGHRAIKQNQAVFNDFLPLLNSVPPAPPVILGLDRESGSYGNPLTLVVSAQPAQLDVTVTSSRLTRTFMAGYLRDKVIETRSESRHNGDAFVLDTDGMWRVELSAPGAVGLTRNYWVGVTAPVVTIVTDNNEPFQDSVLVSATTTDPTATLYHSLDGTMWTTGATVVISQDAVVAFIALTPDGIASDVVSRSFTKRIPWDDAITADAIAHFIAGRIDVNEYLAYSQQFGFFTPFTLYLVGGDWVLDPNRPTAAAPVPALAAAPATPAARDAGPAAAGARMAESDPQPGRHADGPLTITVEAVDPFATVHYTRDGSLPTRAAPSFVGSARFEIPAAGNHVLACRVTGSDAAVGYVVFAYQMA